MWILIITMIIGTFLLMAFGEYEKISKQRQAIFSYAIYGITLIVFSIVLLSHSDFVTDTIKDYQEGRIVRQETITIEDSDIIKVVKYKYK